MLFRRLAVAIAVVLAPAAALGQTETVTYFHTDAIGSVRMITDANQQELARYDFVPFGADWTPTSFSTTPNELKFGGKERDPETSATSAGALDYFGARHYQSLTGRFTTVDPEGVDLLGLVNPQRLNRYAYALNNPLNLVDPDGRDAIVVNFSLARGARIWGINFGHNGIAVVRPDGSVTFSDFGPRGDGGLAVPGQVNTSDRVSLQFGQTGLPTALSLLLLARDLEKLQNAPQGSVRLAYFKTTTAETAALDAWITQNTALSKQGYAPTYRLAGNNCGDYCRAGMSIVNRLIRKDGGISLPNADYWQFWLLAEFVYRAPKATVTTEVNNFRLAR